MLKRLDAKGKHDVHHASNDRERGHPGDKEDRTAPVVASRPEAERELDDPPTSCNHQPSISFRAEMAVMMSNVPAKTRKKLITAARARNVSPGWMNETTPAAMKTTAKTP